MANQRVNTDAVNRAADFLWFGRVSVSAQKGESAQYVMLGRIRSISDGKTK